jgi:hypothetical protein
VKTSVEMTEELKSAKSGGAAYVGYGESELNIPIEIDDAILDISSMDDEMIGVGTWIELDSEGNEII